MLTIIRMRAKSFDLIFLTFILLLIFLQIFTSSEVAVLTFMLRFPYFYNK